MLYNVYPRTFDLTDVTGVMNICDRHMGAIAMRVSYFCNLFVHCFVRVCIRLGSLAIAAASMRDSSTCEGPPQLYNRPCRLRPPSSKRKFAGGASTFTCPALPRDKWFRSSSCRSNWRNATTGQSGPTDSGETRQHVGIVLVIVLGIDQCRDWELEDFELRSFASL